MAKKRNEVSKSKPSHGPQKRPVGRPGERLVVEGDWKAAVKTALSKGKPPKGQGR